MRIIRSFPDVIPPNRSYVVDSLERFYMKDYDYSGLRTLNDDVLLLEWDIAVSPSGLQRFRDHARIAPDWILAAPYKIAHPESWIQQRKADNTPNLRQVEDGEPVCDFTGFGLIYLPAWLLRDCPQYGKGPSTNLSDTSFFGWLWEQPYYKPVPLDWSVRPVHLHDYRVH